MSREYRFLRRGEADPSARETHLVCLDDEGALLLAERMALGGAIEVWDQGRLVGTAPTPGGAHPDAAPAHRPFWAGAWRRGGEGG